MTVIDTPHNLTLPRGRALPARPLGRDHGTFVHLYDA